MNENKIRTLRDINGIIVMYDLGLYSYKGLVSPQLFPPQLSNKYVEITNKAIEYFNKESNENPRINSYLETLDYNLEKNNFIINFELNNEYILIQQPIKIQLIKTNKNIDDFLVEQNFDIIELDKKINILSTENCKYKEEITSLKNDLVCLKLEMEKIKQTIIENNQQISNFNNQNKSNFSQNIPNNFMFPNSDNNMFNNKTSKTFTNSTNNSVPIPQFNNNSINNPTINTSTNSTINTTTNPVINSTSNPVTNSTSNPVINTTNNQATVPQFTNSVSNPVINTKNQVTIPQFSNLTNTNVKF
jgi:hypothetical protein